MSEAGHALAPTGTDPFALAALFGGLLLPPLGIAFGRMSLNRIAADPSLEGRAIALTGFWIGIVLTAFFVLAIAGMMLMASFLNG